MVFDVVSKADMSGSANEGDIDLLPKREDVVLGILSPSAFLPRFLVPPEYREEETTIQFAYARLPETRYPLVRRTSLRSVQR
jgi:hypothetical protein